MISLITISFASAILSSYSPSEPSQFFTVGRSPEGRLCLLDPSKKPFWSFGVCCVEQGTPKKTYDPKNPSYHAWGLFPTESEWAKDSVAKLRKWGFNTLGGWSDYSTFSRLPKAERLPFTVVLHLGAYYRAPWDDLFSKPALDAIDKAAIDQITPIKADPNLIGYFTDNELGWWDDTLFLHYLTKLPEGSAGRKAAVLNLQQHYGSFKQFKADWITSSSTWAEFSHSPSLKLRPDGNGMVAVNAWMRTIGTHYYKTVHDAIRKYDQKHLILGDRYLQYYNIELARSSKPFVDVASTNMGADWNDGSFSDFFLNTLHQITGKPLMITEFYMASTQNRSGNKNSSAAFPIVSTQVERAKAFANNVMNFGKLPYLVGAHWFQFTDEPQNGRGDGENFNMGLLDIYGAPYEEITNAAKASKATSFTNLKPPAPGRQPPVALVDFNPMAVASFKPWPRAQALVPPTSKEPFADLYTVRTKDALYIGLYSMDYLDESLYEDNKIPESERSHWNLTVGNANIDVRFGGQAGKGNPLPFKSTGTPVQIIERPDLKHTLIVKIPWTAIGRFEGPLSFTSTVHTHSRGERTDWKTTLSIPK